MHGTREPDESVAPKALLSSLPADVGFVSNLGNLNLDSAHFKAGDDGMWVLYVPRSVGGFVQARTVLVSFDPDLVLPSFEELRGL